MVLLHGLLAATIFAASTTIGAAGGYFALQCVDKATGRGVPRVLLSTVDHSTWLTDSNGMAAIEVTGRENLVTFFVVATDGYEVASDAFGNRGVKVTLVAGGNATVHLMRTQKAERLYRLTGFGVFYDSVLLNLPVPTSRPLLNGGVLGQDSILSVVFDKKTHWFWGDTNHMSYPLGNFETSGATSCAPTAADPEACLSPDVAIDLTYFTVQDPSTGGVFTKKMAPFDTQLGSLPTWIGSVSVIPDVGEHSIDGVAMTMLFQKPNHDFSTAAIGAAVWNPEQQNFTQPINWSLANPSQVAAGCCGQAVTNSAQIKAREGPWSTVITMDDGKDWVVFAGQTRGVWPMSVTRVPATVAAFKDADQYESFTPLLTGSTPDAPKLGRDANGDPDWQWRRGVPPLTQKMELALVQHGKLRPSERRTVVYADDGAELTLAGGSVHWNGFKQKYIAIIGATPGPVPDALHSVASAPKPSFDGEIYYAESDSLTSGWSNATLVITHSESEMSCYNPLQLPMYDDDEAGRIYITCTFVNSFSGVVHKQEKYDYNNMVFGLDLADV